MAQTIKLKRSATSGAAPGTSDLALGEVAINTYDGKMYIKKSVSGAESVVEVGSGTTVFQYADAGMVEYEYTATANQTTFSGTDTNSATLSYTANSVLVFLNGVLQDDGTDYTATNGTSVVFTNALAANDEVRIISISSSASVHNPTKLDAITTVNGQAAYTMNVNSVGYTPSHQNALIVSVNGITQEPGDSFTISGTTITFSPALVTGDVIDYIVDMGRKMFIPSWEGDLEVTGNILPGADSTYDLGASGTEWANVYADTVTANLTGNVTGTVSSLSNHDTDDLSEGSTNLYHTTERVQDVTGGQLVTNGTHTGISFSYDDANDGAIDATVSLASFDTDDLSEGSTNLYYTDARVDSRLASGSVGNIVTTGYLRGPSTFTIDPATHGDNTGTLVVAGNLQVDGTTTTINSTTMTVDDLNITLASGAANAAAANGAGITVDGASASLTYNGTNNDWNFNKTLNITGDLKVDSNATNVTLSLFNSTNSNGYIQYAANGTMRFYTGAAGGSTTIRSEIDSVGRMRIGTQAAYNSYADNLVVEDTSNAGITIATTDTSARTSLYFADGTAGTDQYRGVIEYRHDSDKMYFWTNGTDHNIVIDSSGRLGIGTASPDGKLNVFSASAGSVSADADADELVLENSGNVGLSLLTAGTGESGIYFGNPGTNGQKDFYLKFYHESHATTANRRAFTFNTASTERMRIDSSGNVGIGVTSPAAALDVAGTIKVSTGTDNVGVGGLTLAALTSGSDNVGVGYNVLNDLTTGTQNTAMGHAALDNATTPSYNTAFGAITLTDVTTGVGNTAVGWSAGANLVTDSYVTAIGYNALSTNTGHSASWNVAVGGYSQANATSYYNTSVGYRALEDATSHSNTAVGRQALAESTSGTENTAVGALSMDVSTTASYSTALGSGAAGALTTGSYNTALGRGAFSTATTATNSVAVGNDALKSNTTGDFNHAFGVVALYDNTTGENNVAVGYAALYNNTTASGNTAVGHNACFANQTSIQLTGIGFGALQNATSSANTAVGYAASYGNTSGYYNVAIGDYALYDSQTSTNHVAVGHYALFENTTADSNTAVGSTALQNTNTGSYNVGVGRQAGQANTSGVLNTFVGFQAASSNTSGGANTAVGSQAFSANTTASYCVAVGYQTLDANTTGARNCAVGYVAMGANTTGNYNTALGSYALFSQTTPNFNVGVGYQAGYNTTTAGDNTYIGSYAGYTNATGLYNVAIGYQAAYYNTRSHNTAVGFYALLGNTTGDQNDAHGRSALQSNTTGSRNCAVGAYSLYSKTTGDNNTALGYAAGYGCTTGNNNTFVGAYNGSSGGAGYAMTSGSKNTILGSFTGNQHGLDIRTASNYIVLSDGGGNPRLLADSDGDVVISGTAALASALLTVDGNGDVRNGVVARVNNNAYWNYVGINSSGSNSFLVYGDGDVENTNNAYTGFSDARLKSNIVDASSQIDDIMAVQVRSYTLNETGATHIGVVAQELEASGMSGLVKTKDDGMKSVKYSILYMKAIKALQEAITRIETLEAELSALKGD